MKLAAALGVAVAGTGIAVMAGWIFDIAELKSILPMWVTMKFSTALTFLLSGITLFFLALIMRGKNALAQIVLPITTLSIMLLMATLLAATLLGIHSGIEDMFIEEAEDAVKSVAPGRPSVGTMISFILIGISGILPMFMEEKLDRWLFSIGCLVGVSGGLAIVGYILDLPLFYYTFEGFSTAMALHTAISIYL